MFKTLLALILLMSLSVYTQQERCKCKLPKATPDAEEDDPEQEYIYKKMYGQIAILGGNGEPIEDMTIEVYDHPEAGTDSNAKSKVKQRLVGSCKTDKNGMFCFDGIKPGKYEIRVSDRETNRKWGPWEDATLLVTINPRHPQSTDRLIKTHLQFRI